MSPKYHLLALLILLLPLPVLSADFATKELRYSETVRSQLEKSGQLNSLSSIAFRVRKRAGKQVFLATISRPGGETGEIDPALAIIKEQGANLVATELLVLIPPLGISDGERANFRHLDFVALTPGPENKVWIGDRRLPSLLQVDVKTGQVERWLRAGRELPAIAADEGGFAALSYSPSRDGVLAMLNRPSAASPQQIRLIEYAPDTGAVRQYGYPIGGVGFEVAGFQALSNDENLLLLDQLVGAERSSVVERFNLTNIEMIESPAVEAGPAGANRVAPVRGEPVAEFPRLSAGEYRGLSVLPDGATLVSLVTGNGAAHYSVSFLNLTEPVIVWGWREYALLLVLGIIFIGSLLFVFRVVQQLFVRSV